MKKLFLLISILYAVLTIHFFDTVSRYSDHLYEILGQARYDLYIVGVEIIILFPLVSLIAWKSLRGKTPGWKLSAWGLYSLALYLGGSRLIINRIEHIHYPEYAILSILLYLAYRRYLAAFWTGSVIGLLDEYLQTVKELHPLDLNDIYFNVLGVVGGLLLIWSVWDQSSPPESSGSREIKSGSPPSS